MKKKEILVSLILAVLATGLSSLLIPVRCLEICTGWPLIVYESFVGWGGYRVAQVLWTNLALDFLFWFLIIFALW